MSQVKTSTCVSIAGLIATVFGSIVAMAQVPPMAPPKIPVATIPPTTSPIITGPVLPARVQAPLRGFVDLHTHPLSYLGFGGKLVYGGVDVGSWLPPETPYVGSCFVPGPPTAPPPVSLSGPNNTPYVLGVAGSEADALGHEYEVHGPGFPTNTDNPCGDQARNLWIIALQSALTSGVQLPYGAVPWWVSSLGTPLSPPPLPVLDWWPTLEKQAGPPNFPTWPTWFDEVNQRMWVDWIHRAQMGGLRVMVALAVNNRLLANLVSGPGDLPTDDKFSADLQIAQIIAFVGRHPDFMQVAYNSSDVYNIVSSGRLAVVVGVEIDNIGDLVGNLSPCNLAAGAAQCPLVAEVDRLYNEGVRYIFPVHLVDNPIGGAAAYNDLFNVADVYEEGSQGAHGFALGCSGDNITYQYTLPNQIAQAVAQAQSQVGAYPTQLLLQYALPWLEQQKLGTTIAVPPVVNCPYGTGNVNTRGLTLAGAQAIQEMMNKHMLIDIDHMSEATISGLPGAPGVLALAQQQKPYPYPLNSGHNGLRGVLAGPTSERSLSAAQYAAIGQIHGMAGIGSAQLTADQWLYLYQQTTFAMNNGGVAGAGVAGFGTDTDGLEFGMPPRGTSYGPGQCPASFLQQLAPASQQQAATTGCFVPSSNVQPGTQAFPLPPASDGSRIWNYNFEGVAHYGMLPDFLADVASLPGGTARDPVSGAVIPLPSGAVVYNNGVMNGAQYFYATWRLAEGNPLPQCPALQQPDATGLCTCPAATQYDGHGGCACPNATQTYMPTYLGMGTCGCPAPKFLDQNGNCVMPGAALPPPVCPAACKYGCNAITKACNAQPPKQIQLIPH